MKKTVSIDLWGTLIKSSPSFKQESLNLIITESPLQESSETLLNHKKEVKNTLNFLTESTGIQISNEDMFQFLCSKLQIKDSEAFRLEYQNIGTDFHPQLLPEVQLNLDRLQKKYDLILSCNTMFLSGSTLRNSLFHLGIDQYFKTFLFSDIVRAGKPKEIMYGGSDFHIGDTKSTDYYGPKKYGIAPFLLSPTLTLTDVTNILLK